MAIARACIRTLEIRWDKQGKTKAQKRRLRYYYRHKLEILMQFKSPMKNPEIIVL